MSPILTTVETYGNTFGRCNGRGDGRLFNTVLRELGYTFLCFLGAPLRVLFRLGLADFSKNFRAKMDNNLFDDSEVDFPGKIEDLILSGDDLEIESFSTEQLIKLGRKCSYQSYCGGRPTV